MPIFKRKRSKKSSQRVLSQFLDEGFHGDKIFQSILDPLMKSSSYFIETGTNVGSTLHFVGRNYPTLQCYSCEPHPETYHAAKEKLADLSNVTLHNKMSPDFLYDLAAEHQDILPSTSTFWIDSHGFGFQWPLKEEIRYITEKFSDFIIAIDDFQVPGFPEFGYDEYDGQKCDLDFIQKDMVGDLLVYFPGYKEKTSAFHELRGWCIIVPFDSKANELLEPFVKDGKTWHKRYKDGIVQE